MSGQLGFRYIQAAGYTSGSTAHRHAVIGTGHARRHPGAGEIAAQALAGLYLLWRQKRLSRTIFPLGQPIQRTLGNIDQNLEPLTVNFPAKRLDYLVLPPIARGGFVFALPPAIANFGSAGFPQIAPDECPPGD